MKFLIHLLCCFIPHKGLRDRLKHRYISNKSRIRKLRAAGFRVEDTLITTPQGVKIDTSYAAYEAIYITKEVFLNNDYAFDFKRDSILIDIGFNRGLASLYFATFPNIKKIYSYEPFSPTFALAKKNLALNPQLSAKINAFNVGLGKEDAVLQLPYMDQVTGGMSTTCDVCKGKKDARTETVNVRDAAGELAPVFDVNKQSHIIVKCDCEGAEFEIFERLDEAGLIGNIDVLLMEYHYNDPNRLIDMLTKRGFIVRIRVLSQKMNKGYLYAVQTVKKGS